jgi:hypothetical protein
MSNINTNKYLSNKLSNILVNEIEEYISYCIDTGNLDYTEKIDEITEEDNEEDEAVEELIMLLFNDYINGFNFAYIAEDTTKLNKHITTLIQYCNEFYEENYGEQSIINWRDFDDFGKIINHAGYVFVNMNKEWFVKTWNKLIDGEYNNCLK